jgi:hypothetical protein
MEKRGQAWFPHNINIRLRNELDFCIVLGRSDFNWRFEWLMV